MLSGAVVHAPGRARTWTWVPRAIAALAWLIVIGAVALGVADARGPAQVALERHVSERARQ